MKFRARALPTAFTLLGLILLVFLGSWQAKRYLEKKSFEEARDSRIVLPVLALDSEEALRDFHSGELDYRRLELRGTWEADRLFLVRHRIHQGEPGFWIVMGFSIELPDGETLRVPINRGWAPRQEAHQLAEKLLESPQSASVSLVGLLHLLDDPVADRGFRRSLEEGPVTDVILTVDSYDAPAMIQAFEMDLPRPLVITLGDDAQEANPGRYPLASYDHVTEPYLTSETHFGYALTWYVLGLALIMMYIASGMGLLESRGYDESPPPDQKLA